MAVKQKTALDIAADLRAPFEDDLIEKVDGFSNVAPEHYLERLFEAALGKYSIERGTPVVIRHGDAAAVAIVTKVIINHGDSIQAFADIGSKALDDSEASKQIAYAIKSASSDSLKRALLGAGLGIDMYLNGHEEEEEAPAPRRATPKPKPKPAPEEEEEDEAPAPRRTTRSAAPSSGKEWTGNEKIGFGAHADEKWSQVDGSWLAFCEGKFDDGPRLTTIKKEIKRRKAEGSYDPEEGQKKPTARRESSRSSGRGRSDDF